MTFKFRLVAFDETRYWNGLPPECTKVFGVYLFCEGERTHCCSLMPSSWCEFIENVFVGLDSEHPFVEEHGFLYNDDMYTFFIEPEKMPRFVSKAVEFDAKYRDEAWEEAREYFRGNGQIIPCLEEAATA